MNRETLYACVIGLCLWISCPCAQPAERIAKDIEDGASLALTGNLYPGLNRLQDLGPADPSLSLSQISIHFSMTAAQKANLELLLRQLQSRGNTHYHKWLTPEQYADRFGLSENDIQKVILWLEQMGFTQVTRARSRSFVSFAATAAQVQQVFHTSIHRYQRNGEIHYANSTEPELPASLKGAVAAIQGLHNFLPKPASIRPHYNNPVSVAHSLLPDDFATIYNIHPLYGSGLDGTGVTIVIPGQTDIQLTDIRAFRSAIGLPAKDPQIMLIASDPGTNLADMVEADLDIEWAGAIAKNANILYVNSPSAIVSMQYAIDHNLGDVIAVTYGVCEPQLAAGELNYFNGILAQASAQGITVVAASGDSGPAACDTTAPVSRGPAVDMPSASPLVTSVGGTELTDDAQGFDRYWGSNNAFGGSALSYIPEVPWDDQSTIGRIFASGGGASINFSKPTWQTGTGVPNDGARDVPDIALAASPYHVPYVICTNGTCANGIAGASNVGGTSAGAPSFAAVVALLDQHTATRQGTLNQSLYALASVSPDAFHDITLNGVFVNCVSASPGCPTGSFGSSAGVGYDTTTGLGSINADNLVREWTSEFELSVNPSTLSISRGSSATSTIALHSDPGFSGTVSYTCTVATQLTNTTCSVSGSATGSATVTLQVTASNSSDVSFRPRIIGPSPWNRVATIAWIVSLLTTAVCLTRRRNRKQLFAAAALLVVLTAVGCGSSSATGSSSGTPTPASQSGLITVYGSSGSLTHTTTVMVTVQ